MSDFFENNVVDHIGMLPSKTGQNNSMNLLVVEDDTDTASLIQMAIRAWDLPLNVEFAADGLQAIRHLMRKRPDILVLDMRLPMIDGYTVMNTIRESGNKLPILMVTGLSEDEISALGGIPENVFYVPKPVDLRRLEKIFIELIGHKIMEEKQ